MKAYAIDKVATVKIKDLRDLDLPTLVDENDVVQDKKIIA